MQPILSREINRNTSIASPCADQLPCPRFTTALLQSEAHRIKFPSSLSVSGSSTDISRSQLQTLFPFQTLRTTIFPVVRVPVLSQQISPIPPSASIESRLRTMAFRRAICVTPFAMVMATTAVRDSGMIAKARAIAYKATSEEILNRDIEKTMMTRINAVIRRK